MLFYVIYILWIIIMWFIVIFQTYNPENQQNLVTYFQKTNLLNIINYAFDKYETELKEWKNEWIIDELEIEFNDKWNIRNNFYSSIKDWYYTLYINLKRDWETNWVVLKYLWDDIDLNDKIACFNKRTIVNVYIDDDYKKCNIQEWLLLYIKYLNDEQIYKIDIYKWKWHKLFTLYK